MGDPSWVETAWSSVVVLRGWSGAASEPQVSPLRTPDGARACFGRDDKAWEVRAEVELRVSPLRAPGEAGRSPVEMAHDGG